MGVADAIPGVSGGTIALILGFYDRLIDSVSDAVGVVKSPLKAESWRKLRRSLVFLVPLAAGIGSALYLATKVLVGKSSAGGEVLLSKNLVDGQMYLADHPPAGLLVNPQTAPFVFAFFFGLVFWSISEPWSKRQNKRPVDLVLFLLGAFLPAAMVLLPGLQMKVSVFNLIWAGALAISVMLLPGISGSLALLVIGMYQPVSAAAHNHDFGTLIYFGGGIVLGLIIFIPILRMILYRFHDRTMAVLSGLMGGSLVALWPWKPHYMPKLIPLWGSMKPQWPELSFVNIGGCLLFAVMGGALIVFGRYFSRTHTAEESEKS